MRDSYISAIHKATKRDNNVLCLVGDIGAFLLRHYIRDFPQNFYNLGAAEANMIGVAAGLAMSGKIPFVYTITPFVTSRCYEQIKDDVCYNNANVKLVGIGSGVSYGTMGSTHHSLEDIAIMSALPNMVVISPSDPLEVEEAVFAATNYKGPVYIRLTLKAKSLIYSRGNFQIGKARIVRRGTDVAIIAAGDTVPMAIEAAELLEKQNIQSYVVNMHTIKPLDKRLVQKLSRECKVIISVEEHSVVGGLGSAIGSVLSQYSKNKSRYKIMGFQDVFCKEYSHDKTKILKKYGLSAQQIVRNIRSLYTI